jgi:hypothetical protein
MTVGERSTPIDGIHLENEILIRMPVLQKFSFNIVTYNGFVDEINRQSNDDIRRTFLNKRFPQVVCYIDYHRGGRARSHIYSLPYTMDETLHICSSFSSGFSSNVRHLLLIDDLHPFEHDFFDRLSQAFPLLNILTVFTRQPQKYKRSNHTNQDKCVSSIIEFLYLTSLVIIHVHIDYVEQLLVETNTHLPRLVKLSVDYEHLAIVTENFTRAATRQNCSKLESIYFSKSIVYSKNFYLYFANHK